MAGPRYVGYKRPKNTKKTILHLLHYLGRHKWMFGLVALLVLISTSANLMGTYLLKPLINRYIVPHFSAATMSPPSAPCGPSGTKA